MAPTRPIVRYHGGKWKLAPWIIEHFPSHKVYLEPFGGAASVLLRKERSYAEVYNDLDGDMVNLFRVARDHGDALLQRLRLTPFAREEFASAYEPTDDPVERARRTVVRAFMGFGGAAVTGKSTGFRSNSNRSGTTPAHDWANYPTALSAVIDRLQGVVLENRDAIGLLPTHDGPETLIYVDPPYVASTRDRGTDYRHELSDAQHRSLADALHAAEGMVVVSGYPCPLYDNDLYSDWYRVERMAFADGARARVEVLWLNDACARALAARDEGLAAAQVSLFEVAA